MGCAQSAPSVRDDAIDDRHAQHASSQKPGSVASDAGSDRTGSPQDQPNQNVPGSASQAPAAAVEDINVALAAQPSAAAAVPAAAPAPPVVTLSPDEQLAALFGAPVSPRLASRRAAAIANLSGADSCDAALHALWPFFPALARIEPRADAVAPAFMPPPTSSPASASPAPAASPFADGVKHCAALLHSDPLRARNVADILTLGADAIERAATESRAPAAALTASLRRQQTQQHQQAGSGIANATLPPLLPAELAHALIIVIRAQPKMGRSAPIDWNTVGDDDLLMAPKSLTGSFKASPLQPGTASMASSSSSSASSGSIGRPRPSSPVETDPPAASSAAAPFSSLTVHIAAPNHLLSPNPAQSGPLAARASSPVLASPILQPLSVSPSHARAPVPLIQIASMLASLSPISSDGQVDVYKCKANILVPAAHPPHSGGVQPTSPVASAARSFNPVFDALSPAPSAPSQTQSESPGAPAVSANVTASSSSALIVQHAVAPVSAEHLDSLRARLAIAPHRCIAPLTAIAHHAQCVYFVAPALAADSSLLAATLSSASSGAQANAAASTAPRWHCLGALLSSTFTASAKSGALTLAPNAPPSVARLFAPMHRMLPLVFAQIAAALRHLHAHGILHGQVSPANICIADDAAARALGASLGASPVAVLNNYWITSLKRPPFARPKHAGAAGASSAAAGSSAGRARTASAATAAYASFDEEMMAQGDVWALAQCMCHVMAGSDTAFARVQRQAPSEPGESNSSVFGVSASAVRTVAASHMQVSSVLLALLEQCLLPSASARPSIDAVYECLVSACSAEDANHLF